LAFDAAAAELELGVFEYKVADEALVVSRLGV
jgi:hypothetical protein